MHAATPGARTGRDERIVELRPESSSARYGIEIKFRCHAQANQLGEVLAALNGFVGMAWVVDREKQSVVFEGPVQQVEDAIRALTAAKAEEPHEGET